MADQNLSVPSETTEQATGGESNESSPVPYLFPQFGEFPRELRYKIWKLHCKTQSKVCWPNPRRSLTPGHYVVQWGGNALLQVNKESRDIALPFYPIVSHYRISTPPHRGFCFRLNLEVDMVIFPDILSLERIFATDHRSAAVMKHVAIRRMPNFPTPPGRPWRVPRLAWEMNDLVYFFLGLKTLEIHLSTPKKKWLKNMEAILKVDLQRFANDRAHPSDRVVDLNLCAERKTIHPRELPPLTMEELRDEPFTCDKFYDEADEDSDFELEHLYLY